MKCQPIKMPLFKGNPLKVQSRYFKNKKYTASVFDYGNGFKTKTLSVSKPNEGVTHFKIVEILGNKIKRICNVNC